jgi:hypothetical protein
VGLLDWFWKRGAGESPTTSHHGAGVPPGSGSEGPPVGVSDPGSILGDDAAEVIAWDEDESAS